MNQLVIAEGGETSGVTLERHRLWPVDSVGYIS